MYEYDTIETVQAILCTRVLSQKIGVQLNRHEVEELMDFIQNMSDSSASHVDYKYVTLLRYSMNFVGRPNQ